MPNAVPLSSVSGAPARLETEPPAETPLTQRILIDAYWADGGAQSCQTRTLSPDVLPTPLPVPRGPTPSSSVTTHSLPDADRTCVPGAAQNGPL
jgi:hypothetical protein